MRCYATVALRCVWRPAVPRSAVWHRNAPHPFRCERTLIEGVTYDDSDELTNKSDVQDEKSQKTTSTRRTAMKLTKRSKGVDSRDMVKLKHAKEQSDVFNEDDRRRGFSVPISLH